MAGGLGFELRLAESESVCSRDQRITLQDVRWCEGMRPLAQQNTRLRISTRDFAFELREPNKPRGASGLMERHTRLE